jgi:hypothetical protein
VLSRGWRTILGGGGFGLLRTMMQNGCEKLMTRMRQFDERYRLTHE